MFPMGLLGSKGSFKSNPGKASTSLGPEQRDAWEKWMKVNSKEWKMLVSWDGLKFNGWDAGSPKRWDR